MFCPCDSTLSPLCVSFNGATQFARCWLGFKCRTPEQPTIDSNKQDNLNDQSSLKVIHRDTRSFLPSKKTQNTCSSSWKCGYCCCCCGWQESCTQLIRCHTVTMKKLVGKTIKFNENIRRRTEGLQDRFRFPHSYYRESQLARLKRGGITLRWYLPAWGTTTLLVLYDSTVSFLSCVLRDYLASAWYGLHTT